MALRVALADLQNELTSACVEIRFSPLDARRAQM